MRKRVTSIFLAALVPFVAIAGADSFQWDNFVVQTNGATVVNRAPTSNSDMPVSAWLDTVIVDIVYGTLTSNLFVMSTLADQGTGPSRTILTLTDVTADGVYPVRDLVTTQVGVDIANEPARVPLSMDKLRLQFYQDTGAVVDATAKVWVVTSPIP